MECTFFQHWHPVAFAARGEQRQLVRLHAWLSGSVPGGFRRAEGVTGWRRALAEDDEGGAAEALAAVF